MSDKTFERIMKEADEQIKAFLTSDLYNSTSKISTDESSLVIRDFTQAVYTQTERTPKRWTGAATEEILSEYFPKNQNFSRNLWENVVPVLTGYVNYINENGYIKNGATIVKAIEKSQDAMFSNLPTFTEPAITLESVEPAGAFADWPTATKAVPAFIAQRKKKNKINKFLKKRNK